MFEDGICQQINKINDNIGWHTLDADDWIYYPQQTGRILYHIKFNCVNSYLNSKCLFDCGYGIRCFG